MCLISQIAATKRGTVHRTDLPNGSMEHEGGKGVGGEGEKHDINVPSN